MTTLIACAVLDVKVAAFSPPMFVRSKAEAIRSFLDATSDPNIAISKHPGDYQLFCLGSFDDQTGRLEPATVPELLIAGESAVR